MKNRELKDGQLYENAFRFKERKSFVGFVCTLLIVVILALSFRVYWTSHFGGIIVDGTSMMKTLQNGDELLLRYGTDAKRGDIIVVDVRSYGFRDKEFLVKRLIGIEGDEIYGDKDKVYIKYAGTDEFVLLEEDYAFYDPVITTYDGSFGSEREPYVVGEGEIFFLGDNRKNSQDSRYPDRSALKDRLYKRQDIYGVVVPWSIEHKKLVKFLPGMQFGF